MRPIVSVIIVNWNGGKVFENCLKSLKSLTYKDWELIVVDNASSDGSLKYISKYFDKVKVIRNNKNVGFAPANNQGVKRAKGKYILLLNNDTIVGKDLLSALVQKMESNPHIGVIQPKIKIMDNPELLDNSGSFFTRIGFLDHWGFMKKDSREFDQEKEVFSTKGACMMTGMEIVKKVGLFDPDFVSYFEESDFCWRVWLAGYKVIFFPKTFILHKLGYTIKRMNVLEINYHYYKNRITSLIKNLSVWNLLFILIPHIIISVGIAVIFILRGNYKNFTMILGAIYWNLLNLNSTLKKRRKVQMMRVVSDAQIFRAVGHKVDWVKFFGDFKRVENDIKKNSQHTTR